MATINDVSISVRGKVIATATEGEIAPPPAANLTIEDAHWASGITPKGQLDYLQKPCEVKGTAAGKPFKGNFTITGIKGARTIKLTTA